MKFHAIGDSSPPNSLLKQEGLQLAEASFREKKAPKKNQPIQVTPNLHAVVASPRGTLAPTSRQGASAGTTRCGSFVLNKKFEVASLHPVVSVML